MVCDVFNFFQIKSASDVYLSDFNIFNNLLLRQGHIENKIE